MLIIPGIDPEYFNKDSRYITAKLDIYFDGFENDPVEIYPTNYLVDMEIIEEAGAESKNPLGALSANAFSCTLTNFDNIFSPTNAEGPYYGKITTGVMVKAWLKPTEAENWIPMGVFYVFDWRCKMGSKVADVLCTDTVQELLLMPLPDLDIQLNKSFKDFFTYVLNKYGYMNIQVDDTLTDLIPYGFVASTDSAQFLQILCEAAVSFMMSSREGLITVKKITKKAPVLSLTDEDQIMSIDVEQSILKTYNGVRLLYSLPQLSESREVLKVDSLPIPASMTTHDTIMYPVPIFSISAVTLYGNAEARIEDYTTTNFGLNLTTYLTGLNSAMLTLSVTGKSIDLVNQELSDEMVNMLEVDNVYIQSASYAEMYKNKLTGFISSEIPLLSLDVRGNPLLEIGDTVQVESDSADIVFEGIIQRMVFRYDGALSCNMTLINAEAM